MADQGAFQVLIEGWCGMVQEGQRTNNLDEAIARAERYSARYHGRRAAVWTRDPLSMTPVFACGRAEWNT